MMSLASSKQSNHLDASLHPAVSLSPSSLLNKVLKRKKTASAEKLRRCARIYFLFIVHTAPSIEINRCAEAMKRRMKNRW